jgi:diacylglycerol kinase family enzyme
MRATVFHNPTAGAKADKDAILAALRLVDIDAHYVSVKSDDVENALKKNADLVVVAGGDGTIAEVLTRLPDRSLPVALLPLGTANNIARSLGIAGTPQELVERWKIDHTCPLDIGAVKAPWGISRFLEGFGVGVFAEFLRAAAKRKKAEGADNLRKGRELLQETLKQIKPLDITLTVNGKALNGPFLGVEVMNVPFTGPALPLAAKAQVSDRQLDVVCFNADRCKQLVKWLEAPQGEPPPVTNRRGETVEITWADTAHRVDDEYFGNKNKRFIAEITCERERIRVLIPVQHPAQQAQTTGKAA